MYVQPLDGPLGSNSLTAPMGNVEGDGTIFPGPSAPVTGDNISRFVPPWFNDGSGSSPYGAGYGGGYGDSGYGQGVFGPLMGVLQQLMQTLQSLMGYGCSPYGGGNGVNCPPYGNERYFQNAVGASDGDPHLSFNGDRWNNMASQPNLLNSDSFAGGYQISTQVTPPNAKGVTWNQCATISLNGGATTVSMNDQGQPAITNYGQSISIGRGQTLQLGNGESVTCEQNGSLRVCAQNGRGGRIDTTLTAQGKGVNVDVTAHDVDLGGALVNGYEREPRLGREPLPQPFPVPPPIVSNPIEPPITHPIEGPITNPIGGPFEEPPIEVEGPYTYTNP
jgi:hypothetical protein